MSIPEMAITRRGALAVGAGAVIGGLGLSRTAQAVTESKPAKLTTAQLAGQRVIFSYPGATPPASLLDQISAGEAGGVIFFGENITSLTQIAGVVAQLKEAHAASPVRSPLLIMTDQEGGIVRRLPGEPVLSEKQIGESADPAAQAADAGTGAGENLAGAGMNTNLAPVLDVFRQAGNFDDEFGRSYSMDPNVCAECGVLAARAGMDVLLCSARDVSEGQDTVAALADALQHHALDPGHFQIALRRVLALRDSLA
jgi:beta-N-acetylhexosaminidase